MDPTLMAHENLESGKHAIARSTVEHLYRVHYVALTKTARLLVGSSEEGEEVAQDAFIALYRGWEHLHDPDRALAYLRSTVVNLSRGRIRRRMVARRHSSIVAAPPSDLTTPRCGPPEVGAIRTALNSLSPRQREAVVLLYYGGLSEGEVARAMGISEGALKSHLHRARVHLAQRLEAYR
jgi:RNA polymerase sigma-70 factor (sigma-E family)